MNSKIVPRKYNKSISCVLNLVLLSLHMDLEGKHNKNSDDIVQLKNHLTSA